MHYHLDTDVFDKKVQHCEKVYFKVGYVVRPSKLIIYENPKILNAGCSRNGFVIDFYIKIGKLVIFTTYKSWPQSHDQTHVLLEPLRWRCAEMHGSPRTECTRRNTLHMHGANKQ